MNCPNCGYNPEAQSYAYQQNNYQQNNYQQRMMAQAQGMRNQLAGNPWQNIGAAHVVRMETDIPTTPRESNDPPPEPKPTSWDQLRGLLKELVP